MVDIKICGLTRMQDLDECIALPVRYVGLNFIPTSKRYINPRDASWLSARVPTGMRCVGLFADPDDAYLLSVIPHIHLDMIQLHGNETPGRVAAIKALTAIPVMKAIPIADQADLAQLEGYSAICDWLLFDAKAGHGQSGGLGQAFDWSLLRDVEITKPWMLAGGLTADNVAQALDVLSPDAVDVSSGVEGAHAGQKDPCKLRRFVDAVRP